jgi:E3 ubiquitin-protein ligase ATL41
VIVEVMSGSASTTLQYTGIGVFIAILLLGLIYFGRSINTAAGRRRRGRDAGAGHVDAVTGEHLGLAPDDVDVLPKFTFHAAPPGRWVGKAKAASPDSCAVCLDELREGALVRMLPSCKHYFHASCVDVWLLSRATCPVCRASPGPEKVRQGLASMSPPLSQLRPCGASPKGGETSRVNNAVASTSPSPVIRSPAHSEVFVHANNAVSVMSPSPARPMTPDSRMGRSSSPSPARTYPHLAEVV